ncbi:hypothetical protein NEIFLAOT_00873 [Neisseria flavescens NRL30031/H210]|uniref:Uncharacterized protein n=1 Tax=Neisseria flavescens NRL30031/H210 TaxID=546264 RepID=C0ELR1_NEIFL|nr:hypothetical protein NEIFLAOT_00873 [Neisseria flavescens NRL30031/H210]
MFKKQKADLKQVSFPNQINQCCPISSIARSRSVWKLSSTNNLPFFVKTKS